MNLKSYRIDITANIVKLEYHGIIHLIREAFLLVFDATCGLFRLIKLKIKKSVCTRNI